MLANKRKFRFCVVEFRSRRPRVHSVARLTSRVDGAVVPIRVTRNALRVEPEKRFAGMGSKNSTDIVVVDILCIVALFTLDGAVLACEDKPGRRMVELRFVKLRDLRISPDVFSMAGNARCGSIHEMESVTAADLILNLNVTREALRAVDCLSAFVALRAVGNPFEIHMSL